MKQKRQGIFLKILKEKNVNLVSLMRFLRVLFSFVIYCLWVFSNFNLLFSFCEYMVLCFVYIEMRDRRRRVWNVLYSESFGKGVRRIIRNCWDSQCGEDGVGIVLFLQILVGLEVLYIDLFECYIYRIEGYIAVYLSVIFIGWREYIVVYLSVTQGKGNIDGDI